MMPRAVAAPRVVYLGMFGALSRIPLTALLVAGVDVRAVVVPASVTPASGPAVRALPPPDAPPAAPPLAALLRQTIVDVAWQARLPVLEITHIAHPAVVDALTAYRPNLLAVSCFPFRLPPALLTLPSLGCLNVHPAPLPRHRGPLPLFWTFHEAVAGPPRAGVTVHLMDEGLDSGPIVAQEEFTVPDGLTGAELELQCAARAGPLLAGAIARLASGTARPMPQDDSQATTDSWPAATDFVVTPDRPARWAFNFIRGTAGSGYPHQLVVGDACFTVRAARAYNPTARLTQPYTREGALLHVQCRPGVLTVEVAV